MHLESSIKEFYPALLKSCRPERPGINCGSWEWCSVCLSAAGMGDLRNQNKKVLGLLKTQKILH